MMNRRRLISHLGVVALLAGCGSSARQGPGVAAAPSLKVPGINCAPFARELSGIALYGDADSWWHSAAGRYGRSEQPVPGGVLVFKRTSRLRSGHVSVVTRVVSARQILVTQANWVPGHVDEDQLVVDLSDGNDWSQVRVWYPPAGTLGTNIYPAHGFIHPRRPATHAELARATPVAARYAMDNRGRPAPRARVDG
jgi:surface antigen